MIELTAGEDDENCINSEQLIFEVEVRPVLYDRCLHRAFSGKELLRNWSDVARSIRANRDDCIRKWKKLVKTFKFFHQTSSTMLEQWTYYDQMQFLLPYAKNDELVIYDESIVDINHHTAAIAAEDDDDDDDRRTLDTGGDDDMEDSDSSDLVVPDLLSAANTNKQQLEKILFPADSIAVITAEATTEEATGALDTSSSSAGFLPPAVLKYDFVMDNEELFLLSFAPNLMRLSAKQNAMARMRILEELYKLEFE